MRLTTMEMLITWNGVERFASFDGENLRIKGLTVNDVSEIVSRLEDVTPVITRVHEQRPPIEAARVPHSALDKTAAQQPKVREHTAVVTTAQPITQPPAQVVTSGQSRDGGVAVPDEMRTPGLPFRAVVTHIINALPPDRRTKLDVFNVIRSEAWLKVPTIINLSGNPEERLNRLLDAQPQLAKMLSAANADSEDDDSND